MNDNANALDLDLVKQIDFLRFNNHRILMVTLEDAAGGVVSIIRGDCDPEGLLRFLATSPKEPMPELEEPTQ